MKLWLRKVGPSLQPFGEEDKADFERMPYGKSLKAEITQPRNVEFLRLYWALVKRVAQGIGKDPDWVDWALRVETGHCDVFMTRGGREVLRVRSISFAEMPDETSFRTYFNECVGVIYDRWGIDPASVADLLLPRGMS